MEHHIRFDSISQSLELLDQRVLPTMETFVSCKTSHDVIDALKQMVVRGAPAIGVAAAWACVLAALELQTAGQEQSSPGRDGWEEKLDLMLEELSQARPTAVNLSWAVDRMRALWKNTGSESPENLAVIWKAAAARLQAEDIESNKRIGMHGAALIDFHDTVMTHCNAGALATAGYGTALGVIYASHSQGKNIRVIANETRPFLQGARLTAYELHAEGIPVTVACDNACALLMQRGMVQKVVVGADRIAANGDTANKLGTYGVALLAKAHDVPFYIAAPLSTIDRNMASGKEIPIEERPDSEVTAFRGARIVPEAVPVFNFAFDVTPAQLIHGIITEHGVLRAPYSKSIVDAFARAGE